MKNAIIILVLTMVSASANAQGVLGDIIRGARDAGSMIKDANSTIRDTKKTVDETKQGNSSKPQKGSEQTQATPAPQQAPAVAPAAATRTVISIEKCDFNQFRALMNSLKSNPKLNVAEQSFNEAGVSSITVVHSMNEYELFDIADAQMPGRLNPKRMDKNAIVLTIKQG